MGCAWLPADADLYRRAEQRTRAVIDLAAYLGAMVNIGRLRGRLDSLGGATRCLADCRASACAGWRNTPPKKA